MVSTSCTPVSTFVTSQTLISSVINSLQITSLFIQVTTLTGHTYRVLYLALSPDGQTIVTGAGDETLRFWNVFPGSKSRSNCGGLALSTLPFSRTIR